MQSILWDRWFENSGLILSRGDALSRGYQSHGAMTTQTSLTAAAEPQAPPTSQEKTTKNPGNEDLLYSIGALFAPLKHLEQALTTRPIACTVNPNDSHDTDNFQDDVMAIRGPNIIEKPVDKKGPFVHPDSKNPKDLAFSPSYSCTIDATTPQSAVSQSDTVVETPSPLGSPQGASQIASPVAALPSPKLLTPLQRLRPPAAANRERNATPENPPISAEDRNDIKEQQETQAAAAHAAQAVGEEAAAALAQPAAEVNAKAEAKEKGSAINDTSSPPPPERDPPLPEATVRNCQSLSLNCCSIASNSACTSAASSRTAPVSPLILNEGQLLQASATAATAPPLNYCNSACNSNSYHTAPVSPLFWNEGQLKQLELATAPATAATAPATWNEGQLKQLERAAVVEESGGLNADNLEARGDEENFEHQLMQKFDCAHTKMAYLYQQVCELEKALQAQNGILSRLQVDAMLKMHEEISIKYHKAHLEWQEGRDCLWDKLELDSNSVV